MSRYFNLVDEKWILTVSGKASLRDIFDPSKDVGNLIGTPLEKISIFRFLLALLQRSWTPEDREEWLSISADEIKRKVLAYLDDHYDLFWFYDGDRPFLQVRSGYEKALKCVDSYHMVRVDTSDNMVITSDLQQTPSEIPDEERVRLLLVILNFALPGKKWSVDGRRPVPASHTIGRGYVLVNLLGDNLMETLLLNILTREEMESLKIFPLGFGIPIWEEDISFSNETRLRSLKNSYLGVLVPLGRFLRFEKGSSKVYFGPGPIVYEHNDGEYDPFWVQVKDKNGNLRYKEVDVERGIIRELPALVEYASEPEAKSAVLIQNMQFLSSKLVGDKFGLFVGGIRFSSQSGGGYISGKDDWLNSVIHFPVFILKEGSWVSRFKMDISKIDGLSKTLLRAVREYWFDVGGKDFQDKSRDLSGKAESEFWKFVGLKLQEVIDSCGNEGKEESLYKDFSLRAISLYNLFCPRNTPKQVKSWVKHAWFV